MASNILLVSFLLFAFTAASNSEETVVKEIESKVGAPGSRTYPPPATPGVKYPPPPAPPGKAPKPPRNTKDCYPLCVVRCKLHSRKNVCMRACVTCCDRCKCVPPGQYGNKEKCGKCYANMTTHGGRPKCP